MRLSLITKLSCGSKLKRKTCDEVEESKIPSNRLMSIMWHNDDVKQIEKLICFCCAAIIAGTLAFRSIIRLLLS